MQLDPRKPGNGTHMQLELGSLGMGRIYEHVSAHLTEVKFSFPEFVYFFFFFLISGLMRSRLNTCPPLGEYSMCECVCVCVHMCVCVCV